jgi:hypothetical protein
VYEVKKKKQRYRDAGMLRMLGLLGYRDPGMLGCWDPGWWGAGRIGRLGFW